MKNGLEFRQDGKIGITKFEIQIHLLILTQVCIFLKELIWKIGQSLHYTLIICHNFVPICGDPKFPKCRLHGTSTSPIVFYIITKSGQKVSKIIMVWEG